MSEPEATPKPTTAPEDFLAGLRGWLKGLRRRDGEPSLRHAIEE